MRAPNTGVAVIYLLARYSPCARLRLFRYSTKRGGHSAGGAAANTHSGGTSAYIIHAPALNVIYRVFSLFCFPILFVFFVSLFSPARCAIRAVVVAWLALLIPKLDDSYTTISSPDFGAAECQPDGCPVRFVALYIRPRARSIAPFSCFFFIFFLSEPSISYQNYRGEKAKKR